MGASNFVGRVGGLAVALGVGAAMFSGSAVAWADRGGDTGASGGSDSGSSSNAPTRGHRGAGVATPGGATAAVARGQSVQAEPPVDPVPDAARNSAPPAAVTASVAALAAAVEAPEAVEPAPEPDAVVVEVAPEPVEGPAPAVDETVIKIATDPVIDDPAPVFEDLVPSVVIAEPQPETAPADGIQVIAYATGSDGSNGAGNDPSGPVDSALSDLVLASFIRRETTASAAATDSPSALVTSSATASSGLTLAPVTTYYDGVLQGNLNVTSGSGCGLVGNDCKLVYSLVGSPDGGKATLNNVPAELPGGGTGSYTFLPYATWIDPANPTKFPTPTGTQDFTVRVSESTKFDQTITGIPLVGLIAAPIIKLMQETPFIGDLLAPLIGASVSQTISVNVGQLVPATKQVAYTYKVTSFDGTLISMNYFPASEGSLLPDLNNQQATIFNGPGFGGAGATDPYSIIQAAGSVPGLALMRGQGPLFSYNNKPLPLGFNVITWDPRGEWASGGILQGDNPFYEGRDVSALIDWANTNTPLLNEGGKPDVAMMGGSYGGGIQMTTVDPRIRSIVPSIAWNSLNDALYPNKVFKTAWAIDLVGALLLSGASSLDRINSQITQGLIAGVLFGSISETAQAVLSSVGPTSLLTKLNIPTMYDQGIIDGLFPLQHALDNAQTQLEQNPFFSGDNADLVKVIWFCGGHGVCTTQTLDQQEVQNGAMFVENLFWVNRYTKDYIKGLLIPNIVLNKVLDAVEPFQWWDQTGTGLASKYMPWTAEFQDTPPIVVSTITGGRINSFTSMSGPLTQKDAAGAVCESISLACQFPLNQVFATKAKNAVNVEIPITPASGYIVGAPKVSFTYSGIGNAKAVYAQIVDNATGQVLGNLNTPIPITLDGKTHTIDAFAIDNIAYTAPSSPSSLTLQIVGNTSMFQNNAVIWGVDINKLTVTLPRTSTAVPNPVLSVIPS